MKRKTRMYEPWGYRDENNYQGAEIIHENDLDSFFAGVEYKRSDNKIHFSNKDGEEVGSLNVNDFIKSDQIVEKAWYENGNIYIKFTNGDLITIDVKELLDENEFKDGLQVNDGQVSVLIDAVGEGYEGSPYLSTSENGVKISGIDKHIFDAVEAERLRAVAEEARLDGRIDQEIADRIADVDAEETRAKAEEAALNTRVDRLNDELDAERTIREAADVALGGRIDDESERATSAETALTQSLAAEVSRAQNAEAQLWDAITSGGSASTYSKAEIDEKVATINENVSSEATARANGDSALEGEISALTSVVNGKADASAIADMATQTWVNSQGFLTEHQDLSDYAKTADVNTALALKADKTEIPTDFYTKGEVDGKDNALQAAIDANTEAINAESARAISAETDIEIALSGKADADVVYTQEEVDALLAEKEAEYSRLKDMVLDLYYATTYSVPTDCGLDTMLKSNNGEAKLTEDLTIGTIAAGTTAKNIVKLNLGGKTVTFTGNTTNNPAMMFRNKQQVNIGGSGTIDAGGRIAIEAYGADCEITLSGTMFGRPTYVTDRSGGELIYCYLGTINITEGIFKNLGEDKTFLLNCYDANYKNGTAKIVVTGGKFYDFDPMHNTAEGPDTNFLAEGYHTEASTVVEEGVEHTVYTVKKDA